MNLSELIPFLESIDAKPKKRLSQNFLIDPNILRKIVQTAEIKPGDAVLEIGPGPGALTAALLERGASVYAVEMDSIFARELHRLQNGKLIIINADILTFPFETLPREFKIAANLPYHITTPILEKVFCSSFSSFTAMVQKEVACRMMAVPKTKEFGPLSLFVQFYAKKQASFNVAPTCFYPRPKIDSTVIRLDRRPLPNIDPEYFFSLSKKAFQKRRKMLSSTLPYPKERIRTVLSKMDVRKDARPEDLSLEQWVALANALLLE